MLKGIVFVLFLACLLGLGAISLQHLTSKDRWKLLKKILFWLTMLLCAIFIAVVIAFTF